MNTARSLAIANENRSIEESAARAVAAAKPRTALEAMAMRLEVSPAELKTTLVKTVFSGCRSESEFLALIVVSNEYGLNPLTKEIYAFPAKGGGVVPMVSVDGWIKLMNSHPMFDGIEFINHLNDNGKVEAIESVIFRKDRSHPIKVIEYLEECKRNTEPWNKMERRMLRNRSLIQGARIAFGFTGIVSDGDDEAIDGGVIHAVTLPTNQTLAEALDDEIPNFDKQTGEVIEDAQDEPMQTDPAIGMTEVDEETARSLDAGQEDQAEVAAQTMQDIDGPLEQEGEVSGEPEASARPADEPLWKAKAQEIRNGIAGAKNKMLIDATEREYLKHCVTFAQEVATELETALAAKKKELAA